MDRKIKHLAEQAGWMMGDGPEGFNTRLERFANLITEEAADELERLRERNHVLKDALQSLCYRWDEVLNNFYDGEEENDAREKARKALGEKE